MQASDGRLRVEARAASQPATLPARSGACGERAALPCRIEHKSVEWVIEPNLAIEHAFVVCPIARGGILEAAGIDMPLWTQLMD